jgi:hypothetical protein
MRTKATSHGTSSTDGEARRKKILRHPWHPAAVGATLETGRRSDVPLLLGHRWWELRVRGTPAWRELIKTWRGTLEDLSWLRRGLGAGERIAFMLRLGRASLEESLVVKSRWDFGTSLLSL